MDKFRKVLLLIILLLVMNLQAKAQNKNTIIDIKKQIQETPRWQKMYEAYGRRINIDCPIIIPNVETIPIYTIECQRPFESQEWINENKCVLNEKTSNELLRQYDDYGLSELLLIDKKEACLVFVSNNSENSNMLFVEDNPPGELLGTDLEFNSSTYYGFEIENVKNAEDNPKTLSDSKKILEKVINHFFEVQEGDVYIDYVEIRERARTTKTQKNGGDGDTVETYPMGTYYISFRQMIDGIPIYADAGENIAVSDEKSWKYWKQYEPITGIKDMYFDFMKNDSFSLSLEWFKKKKRLENDVPLISIEQIIKSIEKEIGAGRIRNIYALKLGYCVFFKDDSANEVILYPVWICECEYFESGKREVKVKNTDENYRKGYNYVNIMINAQTGEVYDYKTKNKKEMFCPDIKRWSN